MNIPPLKRGLPKRKGSSPNQHFSRGYVISVVDCGRFLNMLKVAVYTLRSALFGFGFPETGVAARVVVSASFH